MKTVLTINDIFDAIECRAVWQSWELADRASDQAQADANAKRAAMRRRRGYG